MDLALKDATAVVCGASRGLGLAAATALAGEGVKVVLVARGADELERQAAALGGIAVPGDLRDEATTSAAIEAAVSSFGGIDVLVNNAGGPPPMAAAEITDDAIADAVGSLLSPTVRLTQGVLPHLRKSKRGRIITITSTSTREPIDNLALSNLVRPGLVAWTKNLARELGPEGITVNCVAPGRILTQRQLELRGGHPPDEAALKPIALGRFGEAHEIGAVIAFLASGQASYVTGSTVIVDGGLTRSV